MNKFYVEVYNTDGERVEFAISDSLPRSQKLVERYIFDHFKNSIVVVEYDFIKSGIVTYSIRKKIGKIEYATISIEEVETNKFYGFDN